MEQRIEAPNEEDLKYIAQMWVYSKELASEIADEHLDRTLEDLEKIQTTLDRDILSKDDTQKLHALGIAFGQVYVNEVPGYDWWMVEDDFGRDVCVRYKETSLLIFPQSMLSNRIEDGEDFKVVDLYKDLVTDMEQIRLDNYGNA